MVAQTKLLGAPSRALVAFFSTPSAPTVPASRSISDLWIRPQRIPSFRMPFCSGRANTGEVVPDVMEFLDSLKNFEKLGVPHGAGTDSPEGFDLGRMRRLLSRLGDPLSQYRVVHIAGTKGKGSTAAFISNILRAEGYSVGSYTSPHIQSIRERIIAGKIGKPISSSCFQKLFQDTWNAIQDAIAAEQGSLSHFEVLTALAFKYFAIQKVDIAVIEAGLGGARDATNVVLPSGLAVAVITNVGKEHIAALGGSLESIALAKSGIIKQGCPVVIGGPIDSNSKKIICEVATSKYARVIPAFGEGIHYRVNKVEFKDDGVVQLCNISINQSFHPQNFCSWNLEHSSVRLRLIGQHQLENAMTAICTILCLRDQGWRVKESSIWSGLEQTFLPGRFQIVPKVEAIQLGCRHSTLVLDGAHTAGSAKALADTLKMVFPRHPVALVVAMASDKDHYEFSSQLLLGATPKVVVATEMLVAGGQFRSFAAHCLADIWIRRAKELRLEVRHGHDPTNQNAISVEDQDEHFQRNVEIDGDTSSREDNCSWLESSIVIVQSKDILTAIQEARELLKIAHGGGVVCVTGSLHAVSTVLSVASSDLMCGLSTGGKISN